MLHYIKSDHTVELKGRVACEISNHELMITELVFESVFSDLHPAEIVALLSCFVFEQVLQNNFVQVCLQLRNKAFFPCLHSVVKTEANVWENSRADQ